MPKRTYPCGLTAPLIADILGRFKLGDRELKGEKSFTALRARLDAAIEKLR